MIYPVDSVIHLLNNWDEGSILLRYWIKLYPDLASTRFRIQSVFVMYPVDSVIHLLNNWDEGSILLRYWIKLESGFKMVRMRMLDSPATCGRKLRSKKYPDTCGWSYAKQQLCSCITLFFCTFLSVTTTFSFLSLNLDMVLQLHKNSLAFDKVSQLE